MDTPTTTLDITDSDIAYREQSIKVEVRSVAAVEHQVDQASILVSH